MEYHRVHTVHTPPQKKKLCYNTTQWHLYKNLLPPTCEAIIQYCMWFQKYVPSGLPNQLCYSWYGLHDLIVTVLCAVRAWKIIILTPFFQKETAKNKCMGITSKIMIWPRQLLNLRMCKGKLLVNKWWGKDCGLPSHVISILEILIYWAHKKIKHAWIILIHYNELNKICSMKFPLFHDTAACLRHTSHCSDLYLPSVHLSKVQKAVYRSGIEVFNCLPPRIKSLSSDIRKFKSASKRFFFFNVHFILFKNTLTGTYWAILVQGIYQ